MTNLLSWYDVQVKQMKHSQINAAELTYERQYWHMRTNLQLRPITGYTRRMKQSFQFAGKIQMSTWRRVMLNML